jgi:glycine/D-amino acid oxidase-like deaminating enzyme
MTERSKVCVIGAGPYGLSVAAHLRSSGIDVRVFGVPMRRWLLQMPRNNFLKSEGFASNLSDPGGDRTLEEYCARFGVDYSGYGVPIPRATFVDYGLWFQRELVPGVESVTVEHLDRTNGSYELALSSGECVHTENVVVATGMDYMAFAPKELTALPEDLRSHSSSHVEFSKFRGATVAVVGGGQSALETAAELHNAGAQVVMLVRSRSIIWNEPAVRGRRSVYRRLRWPRSPLGDGIQGWLHSNAPGLFHSLPRSVRIHRVTHTHGPAGAWWLKDRVVGRFPILLSRTIRGAAEHGNRVALQIADAEAQVTQLVVDHVIACTGYHFDLRNLPFLGENLKRQLLHEHYQPALSANFESATPGLYFTGLASSYAFGPAMRFVAGTHHTSRAIYRHLSRKYGWDGARDPPNAQNSERG